MAEPSEKPLLLLGIYKRGEPASRLGDNIANTLRRDSLAVATVGPFNSVEEIEAAIAGDTNRQIRVAVLSLFLIESKPSQEATLRETSAEALIKKIIETRSDIRIMLYVDKSTEREGDRDAKKTTFRTIRCGTDTITTSIAPMGIATFFKEAIGDSVTTKEPEGQGDIPTKS